MNSSTWSLCLTNVLALVVAVALGWQLADLMLLYWLQSVIIGASYFLRMLSLEKFSTENFTMNGRSVDPTPATKRSVAMFFAFHYGFFHLTYLIFLMVGFMGETGFGLDVLACAVIFAVNHAFSYRHNLAQDRAGSPNIGTLMFVPYLRVVPMHMTIILGSMLGAEGLGLVLFGVLKTVADALMHTVEHRMLGKAARD